MFLLYSMYFVWVILRRLNFTRVGGPLSPMSYPVIYNSVFQTIPDSGSIHTVWDSLELSFGDIMPLFFWRFFSPSYSYIRPSPFAEVPLHLLIAGQLSGKNLPGLPSRESNSGMPCSKPTHYHLSYAAPFLSYAAPCLSYSARWNFIPILKLCCCRHWAL